MTKRILRPAEAQARLGIGHTQFYDWIKTGKHGMRPPLRLGPQSVGHTEEEIDTVIDRLAAERRAVGKPPQTVSRKQAKK